MRPALPRPDARPVVGYIRVSTARQDISPGVQRAALTAAAEAEGTALVIVEELGVSAANITRRPQLRSVLDDLRAGRYAGIMVSHLDRLTRSQEDGSRMLAEAQRQGWRIVSLDLNVDTGTPMGAAMFHVALTFAELERRRIGERTRAAMRNKAAQGQHMGRPRSLPVDTVARVVELHRAGLKRPAIAAELNAASVPSSDGQPWTVSRVQSTLETRTAAQISAGQPVTVPARP